MFHFKEKNAVLGHNRLTLEFKFKREFVQVIFNGNPLNKKEFGGPNGGSWKHRNDPQTIDNMTVCYRKQQSDDSNEYKLDCCYLW